jgi:cellulose synthase/poly-beta-1,6-N-acetylglucosamine synthase-like glycosyltransferase
MSAPDVSVVVPMRNAADHVLEQVAALADQAAVGIDFEVIWVDNGSTDATLPLVTKAIRDDKRMRVVSAREVRSSYFARNRGVALAQGDLLLFCDADDVVDKHWVQSMAAALASLDVVGGSLMLDSHTPAVTAGLFFGFLPAAPAANLGFRRDAFDELGGFSSEIPSGDDIAMCWRAQLQGFRFGFASDAVVLHRRRPTEWTRAKRIWAQGRWYREWVAPFVALGAEASTVGAALRRIVERAIVPAIKKPRRDHARVVLWNLAVISSRVARPKPRS